MILDFYIPGEPERTTAQEGHRLSRGHYYTDPKIKAVRQGLIEELKPNAPEEPIAGPVHLRIDFFFGTSDVKKQGCWKVTRPDTDNLIKLMKDCMTEAGFGRTTARCAWKWSRKPGCRRTRPARGSSCTRCRRTDREDRHGTGTDHGHGGQGPDTDAGCLAQTTSALRNAGLQAAG